MFEQISGRCGGMLLTKMSVLFPPLDLLLLRKKRRQMMRMKRMWTPSSSSSTSSSSSWPSSSSSSLLVERQHFLLESRRASSFSALPPRQVASPFQKSRLEVHWQAFAAHTHWDPPHNQTPQSQNLSLHCRWRPTKLPNGHSIPRLIGGFSL